MMWTVASVLHFFASSPCKEAWIGLFFEHQPVFEGDCAVISQPAPF
jgi:hypothetical protein